MLSLLDTVGCNPCDYLLVYQQRGERSAWWTRALSPRFAHVEVWRSLGDGAYLAVQPFHDCLSADITFAEPDGVVQRVVARRQRGGVMFPVGVKTCVSVAKAMLGVRAAWIVTPWQLFRYVESRKGVV